MSRTEQRLQSLGLALPPAKAPVANYLGTKRSGDLLFVAGRVSALRGEVGSEVQVAQARIAARDTMLDLLAIIKQDLGDLDRIAFAVDGVESNHGQNPLMWRPTPDGPQGPMQVSLKAALDVGGGNRFDLRENRLLGRAYLAQMFQRYGNWPDALAAYNWGPGNLEAWIAAGRPTERLPNETARYVRRVLRDALVASAARW